jgi:hypothetical protein
VISIPSRGWGLAEAVMTKALSVSPPPTADGLDKMYHQLAEIHAITITQLTKGARWHCSDSTPSLVWTRTDWRRPDEMPSMTRMAPPPSTNFFPQASLW